MATHSAPGLIGNADPPDNPRETFGWAVYDWANSAYVTTVAVAVLPAYFSGAVVFPGGYDLFGVNLQATSLWGYAVSFASFLVFLLSPFLGAIADFSGSRKKFLIFFCLLGGSATTLMYFSLPGEVVFTLVLFVIAQVGFAAGNVFYDSFLPLIASRANLDKLSARGFAYGYLGGGLQFLFSLILIAGHKNIGFTEATAARVAMCSAGLWWLLFAAVAINRLKERPAAVEDGVQDVAIHVSLRSYIRIGFKGTFSTLKKILRTRNLFLFLLAYMLYNDGIQTVIMMATIYGKEELKLSTQVLMSTLLIIQFVAFGGSYLFARISKQSSAKTALLVSLLFWTLIAIYGYFISNPTQYLVLGVGVGLVMGGSQALSRSFFAAMIPGDRSSEYFGFYSVFTKLSSIWGPLLFAVIRQTTGSSRPAVLSIAGFFILGGAILAAVKKNSVEEEVCQVAK